MFFHLPHSLILFMNGWKAEKAKERQGAVTGVAPGKSFPRDFPTIRYHESTISTKLASHNMRWWAVGQCQGGSPTFSFLCSFSFIAEPFTQTLAWAKPEPRFGKTRRWLRQLWIAFILFAPGPLSGCWHVLTSGEKESRLQHKSLRCFWPLSTILSGSEPQDNNTFLEIFDFT